jgi:predicted RecA/RadA family phage recombinase
MANNFKADGKVVNYVASGPITAGQVVEMYTENLSGIALNDGVSGDIIPVQITGIWEITKNTNTDAYAVGSPVYVDTNGEADPSALGNKFLGYATKQTTTEATVEVLLVQSPGVRVDYASTLDTDSVTASAGYVQAEAQSTMDKIDEVIIYLIAAGIMKNA